MAKAEERLRWVDGWFTAKHILRMNNENLVFLNSSFHRARGSRSLFCTGCCHPVDCRPASSGLRESSLESVAGRSAEVYPRGQRIRATLSGWNIILWTRILIAQLHFQGLVSPAKNCLISCGTTGQHVSGPFGRGELIERRGSDCTAWMVGPRRSVRRSACCEPHYQ
jgi:hypothetical protein